MNKVAHFCSECSFIVRMRRTRGRQWEQHLIAHCWETANALAASVFGQLNTTHYFIIRGLAASSHL